jgi:hypothetical protein
MKIPVAHRAQPLHKQFIRVVWVMCLHRAVSTRLTMTRFFQSTATNGLSYGDSCVILVTVGVVIWHTFMLSNVLAITK